MSRLPLDLGPITDRREWRDPCRFGVIADTHVTVSGRRAIPDGVPRLFERARPDFIVHLGDANTIGVLEMLAGIAPLIAVPGNNDDLDVYELLSPVERFQVGERSFAAIHGDGGRSARSEAERQFAGMVDCVLFGHSHQPLIEQADGTILFNPGSATDRRWGEHFGIGLISVVDGRIDPELILYQHGDHLDNITIDAFLE